MANKIKQSDIFDNILTDKEYTKIDSMVKKFQKNKDMELEVSFRNISFATYMRTSEYLVDIVDEKNISA